ncbi:MAG TPA: hypothetical protein VLG49_07650 [Rhabdochlamydiaceae bacterium]|nr:hypothetical protein [Rhabdochlamydiaceae bacterium]
MNFTREPIIETIITPKEGYKLVIRNTKGGGQEEHCVDAVEVVSFGHSFFFRSLERPKPFLVPVSDYEVVEVKETRVVLKNAGIERAIKIGGGRDASVRPSREPAPEKQESIETETEQASPEEVQAEPAMEHRPPDKKRDRRRHRRRRGGEDRYENREWSEREKTSEEHEHKGTPSTQAAGGEQGGGAHDETQVSSSMFSTLFPPPTTLISETIGRYKDMAFSEGNVLSKPVEKAPEEPKESEEDKESSEDQENKNDDDDSNDGSGSDSTHLHRTSTLHNVSYKEESFSSPTSYKMRSSFSDESYFIT